MGIIQAIDTCYRGYRFRSRLEARWAVFFDCCKVQYIYEQQGFHLPNGDYLPDFFIPGFDGFVEVKDLSKLPKRNFEFGKFPISRLPVDDKFPRELLLAWDVFCHMHSPCLVAYGDPYDVIHNDTMIETTKDGLLIGIGFIDRFQVSIFDAADAARGARFEHGNNG